MVCAHVQLLRAGGVSVDKPAGGGSLFSVREESVREVLGGAEEALLKGCRLQPRRKTWSSIGDEQLQRVHEPRAGSVEIGRAVQHDHARRADGVAPLTDKSGLRLRPLDGEAQR